jgi:hypothetical protein
MQSRWLISQNMYRPVGPGKSGRLGGESYRLALRCADTGGPIQIGPGPDMLITGPAPTRNERSILVLEPSAFDS